MLNENIKAVIVLMFAAITVWNSPYLAWDYSSPETAVAGVGLHAFEWLFVRAAPVVLIAAAAGGRRAGTQERFSAFISPIPVRRDLT